MRKTLSLLIGGVLLAASLSPAIAAKPGPKDEARLAKALEGRVAGKPVDCINQRDIRSSEIISGTAILYRMSGNRIYVNRPKSGATFLDRDDIMVTRSYSDRLCSVDIVRLLDPGSRMSAGSVGLGDFVPYEKPKGN